MDQTSKSHHQHHLGVNKIGKNIRKIPLHQPSFQKLPPTAAAQPPPSLHQQQPLRPPQPQVYNISKSDFRSIVQQLTGSPSREHASGGGNTPRPSRPPPPKPSSSRLMKIRPPPLNPIARPLAPHFPNPVHNPNPNPNINPNFAFYPRPNPSPTAPAGAVWADSPVSSYMRYLESSLLSLDGSRQTDAGAASSQGMLPPAAIAAAPFLSPRGNPLPALLPSQRTLVPSPGSQFPLLSPSSQFPFLSPSSQLPLPSPSSQFPFPSPNSQLLLPSPSSFLNLLSPRSPFPLLSPRLQYPPPLTPNFSFSQTFQSGILGPVPGSQPPPSPSLMFPLSPSGFLPLLSPRWRET